MYMNFNFRQINQSLFIIASLCFVISCSNSGSKKMQKTLSGYSYVKHTDEKGPKPNVGDEIAYHIIVFKNDSLIQSSYYLMKPRKIIIPPVEKVAKPAPPDYEALFLMSEGDSLTVYQKLDTFDVKKLPPGVLPKDTFIYHIKLFDIKPKSILDAEMAKLRGREQSVGDTIQTFIKDFKAGKLNDQLTTTDSGLKYIIHNTGDKERMAKGIKIVDVHYSGFLSDGTQFEETWSSTNPIIFRMGSNEVITGWEEALKLLGKGGSGIFMVPHMLAYGPTGKKPIELPDGTKTMEIPPNSDLIFYLQLEDVR